MYFVYTKKTYTLGDSYSPRVFLTIRIATKCIRNYQLGYLLNSIADNIIVPVNGTEPE